MASTTIFERGPHGTTSREVYLISIRHDRLLYTGGEVTLEAMRPFVGRTIERKTATGGGVERCRLERVSQDRATGDVIFWAADLAGGGVHLRVVAQG